MTALNDLAHEIRQTSGEHGFWEPGWNLAAKMMLIVTEVAEATEADRRGEVPVWWDHGGMPSSTATCGVTHPTSCVGKPEGIGAELIDVVIRCLDVLDVLGVNIDAVLRAKLDYNKTRPIKHGKRY